MNYYIRFLAWKCVKKNECEELEEFLLYERLAEEELALKSSSSLPFISGTRNSVIRAETRAINE